MTKLIPQKIKPFAHILDVKKMDNYGTALTDVLLECSCKNRTFKLFCFGEQKSIRRPWASLEISSSDYKGYPVLIIDAVCDNDGKEIPVFNNLTDGYEGALGLTSIYGTGPLPVIQPNQLQAVYCPKCKNNTFEVEVAYGYSTEGDESAAPKNKPSIKDGDLFDGISIAVKCCNCHKHYKSFSEYETA